MKIIKSEIQFLGTTPGSKAQMKFGDILRFSGLLAAVFSSHAATVNFQSPTAITSTATLDAIPLAYSDATFVQAVGFGLPSAQSVTHLARILSEDHMFNSNNSSVAWRFVGFVLASPALNTFSETPATQFPLTLVQKCWENQTTQTNQQPIPI